MFARKDDATGGTGKPVAPERIESGIEVRVSAARPWIVIPDDRLRGEKARRPPQPADPPDDAALAFMTQDVLKRSRRRTAGQERENAVRAALILVGLPHGTGRRVGAKGGWPTAFAPETPLELQEQLRRAAVAEVRDRVVLRLGEPRLAHGAPGRR